MKKLSSALHYFYKEYLCVCGRGLWAFLGLMHLGHVLVITMFLSSAIKKFNTEEIKLFVEKNLSIGRLLFIGIKRGPIWLLVTIVLGLYLCTAFVGYLAYKLQLSPPDLWLQLIIGLASFYIAFWWSLDVCRGMAKDGSLYRSRFNN